MRIGSSGGLMEWIWGRRNPYNKGDVQIPEEEGGANRFPEDKVSAGVVLAHSWGFATKLNVYLKSLGRLNCNLIFFFFLPASCQLQALIISILRQACSSTSYSFVILSLTKSQSPMRDPIFKTAEG